MAVWSIVPFSDIAAVERWDAEFYQPVYLDQEGAASDESQSLDSVAHVSDGNHLAISEQFGEGPVPYLRGGDLSDFFLRDVEPERIPVKAYDSLSRSHMKPGDVLLSIVGTVGLTALVTDEYPMLTGSCKIAIARPYAIRSGYLAAYLASSLGQHLIARRIRGAVQQGLILPDLKALPVPRLSDDEEGEVDALVYDAYEARKAASDRYADAEALLSDALGLDGLTLPTPICYTAMFSDIVEAERLDAEHFQPRVKAIRQHIETNFGGVPLGTLGKVLKGKTPTGYDDEGIPVIRSGDLVDIDDTSDFKRASPKSAAFRLKSGDVLVSSIGFGSIGKVQIFDHPTLHTTVSEVTVIRQSVLNPYFLQAFLASPLGQIQIESWVTGATGQLHLRPADVEKVVVPIIPEEKQAEFEHLVSEARALKADAARLLDEAKARVEALVLAA